ncbi:hypothetical protein H6P81_020537 [Aristolochia fimbriata]|uniref:Uncharacterized protein n=1 Tax=Aristolochia fimbriata TaxID=158543 RepID=A0AAV7DXY4_ARIFI|nr:hypothetical protein H6P81_020537 [Aristolochia fimbriata]
MGRGSRGIPNIFLLFALVLLLVGTDHFSAEARPLKPFLEEIMAFAGGLPFGAVEGSSGHIRDTGNGNAGDPDKGPEGLKVNPPSGELADLLGVKQAGPSPGAGHAVINSEGRKFAGHVHGLGGIKDSGASPGRIGNPPGSDESEGRKFAAAHVFGAMKDSGPSPGVGHAYVNSEGRAGEPKEESERSHAEADGVRH